MLNFIKRQNIAFYLTVVAFILTIVGIIMSCLSNGVETYEMMSLGAILACAIIAAVLLALSVWLADKFGAKHFLTEIVLVAAMILLMVAIAYLISERAVLAGYQFTYEKDNMEGWKALDEAIAALALFLVSAILLIVGAFFKDKAKETAVAGKSAT